MIRRNFFAATGLMPSARPAEIAAAGQDIICAAPGRADLARGRYAANSALLARVGNRAQPSLFLVQDRYDEAWLDWLRERGYVNEVRWLEIAEVFKRFLPLARCMYITDPHIPASVNVATLLAAVHDGLVATPATAPQYNLPAGAHPDSSKIGMDLRSMNWKKDIDAYRWASGEACGFAPESPGEAIHRMGMRNSTR